MQVGKIASVQNKNCNIFADDTIIYSFGTSKQEVVSKLQGALDELSTW